MNRTEKILWEKIKGSLPGVSDRVENSAGTGFPDVYGDYRGVSYWVELKVASTKKALDWYECTKLFRPSQVVWNWRHVREGAKVLLVVGHPKGISAYSIDREPTRLNSSGEFLPRFNLRLAKIMELNGKLDSFNKLYFISEMRKAL